MRTLQTVHFHWNRFSFSTSISKTLKMWFIFCFIYSKIPNVRSCFNFISANRYLIDFDKKNVETKHPTAKQPTRWIQFNISRISLSFSCPQFLLLLLIDVHSNSKNPLYFNVLTTSTIWWLYVLTRAFLTSNKMRDYWEGFKFTGNVFTCLYLFGANKEMVFE